MTRVDIAEFKALLLFLTLGVVKNLNNDTTTYLCGAACIFYATTWALELYKSNRKPVVKKSVKVK
jgi:hypothetical protein